MFKRQIIIILGLITIFTCKSSQSQESVQAELETSKPTRYFELVDNEFTGDLSYETTAFVEQFWRVVGNKGFDASVYKITEQLEVAGFVLEENATSETVLSYRIEKRPLKYPTWEPVDAVVRINGESEPLLQHSTNRNMIALNSFSTPKEGVSAEVIYVKDLKKIKEFDVKGKIVFAETSPSRLLMSGVIKDGAIGILSYNNPKYLQPEINTTSIQFRAIPYRFNETLKTWAIALSYEAKQRLKDKLSKGKKVILNVNVETKIYPSEELTIIAEIKGSKLPKERLVFSAHIQEPGANDNATGVGIGLEMATVTAKFIKENKFKPHRTLTFLWGDEMVSTERYVQEDKMRAKDIKWGISLDMVGENTAITGGSFLIEKMPDPSAIWTRGKDSHTEWGGRKMMLSEMKPHYLNDFLISIFKIQGERANWVVKTNPFEGGSDHVPFLRGNIPSVLFWHFTDQFYHTDNDRLDKVSKTTLKNVGTGALVSAYRLLNGNASEAKLILKEIEIAAIARLNEELYQGQLAIKNGDALETQIEIIKAWEDWYIKAMETIKDMVIDKVLIQTNIDTSQTIIKENAKRVIEALNQ